MKGLIKSNIKGGFLIKDVDNIFYQKVETRNVNQNNDN